MNNLAAHFIKTRIDLQVSLYRFAISVQFVMKAVGVSGVTSYVIVP